MIITGAFLADGAETNGAKLDIRGAVWDYVNIGADMDIITPLLVVMAQTSPDDYVRPQEISVTVTNPAGEVCGEAALKISELGNRAENRWFYFGVTFKTVESGRYGFQVQTSDDQVVAFGLQVNKVR